MDSEAFAEICDYADIYSEWQEVKSAIRTEEFSARKWIIPKLSELRLPNAMWTKPDVAVPTAVFKIESNKYVLKYLYI